MPTSLSPEAAADIRKLVDDACCKNERQACLLPCATAVVIGKDKIGSPNVVFTHSAQMNSQRATAGSVKNNKSGATQSTSQSDGIHWLASCTKLVTAIACMQLIEQGKLSLDDSEIVEKICPELAAVQVLQDDGSLVDKKRPITLRMLLTHTAGFGYSFLNPKLQRYARQNTPGQTEYDEFSGKIFDLHQPLVNQPGDQFEYGISIDWAGIIIERIAGLKLNDYMQQRIFAPLNIKDVSMFPSPDMKERLIGIWQRGEDGHLAEREYPMQRSLDDELNTLHSGGAGLFGSIREFSKILATLLNDGISPDTGVAILSPATIREMFTNQLPTQPNFARRALPAVKPDLVHPAEELYPLCPSYTPQGWGLSFMISPGITGRCETTAQWSGLSNVFWWCDREKGVAGIVASQVLPFVDPQAAKLWVDVEAKTYEGLLYSSH
ncbi:beta-lactamase/transpeptidase-like protein [Aspergillus pseudoustus]|uniref:Beta-lactamase/transpeptidase-like protein n=1 Tax=Aspergillus pseudoustus TaxID=1810923 RepID=A0ABR4JB91_9EURO